MIRVGRCNLSTLLLLLVDVGISHLISILTEHGFVWNSVLIPIIIDCTKRESDHDQSSQRQVLLHWQDPQCPERKPSSTLTYSTFSSTTTALEVKPLGDQENLTRFTTLAKCNHTGTRTQSVSTIGVVAFDWSNVSTVDLISREHMVCVVKTKHATRFKNRCDRGRSVVKSHFYSRTILHFWYEI